MPTITFGNLNQYDENGNLEVDIWSDLKFASANFTGIQTDTTLITPTSGKKIEVHAVFISSSTNTGSVDIEFLTSGLIVAMLYLAAQGGTSNVNIHADGAVDEVLSISCPANTFISVSYHEHN